VTTTLAAGHCRQHFRAPTTAVEGHQFHHFSLGIEWFTRVLWRRQSPRMRWWMSQ
jgi:hypothetical protein